MTAREEGRPAAEFALESASPDQTRALGERLGAALRVGDCVALRGGLGAGKTTLAQGVLAGAGVAGPARSPTYALVHEHRGRLPVRHLDVYRLSGPDDFEAVGGAELFEGAASVVEWPERIEPFLPADRLEIALEPVPGDGSRRRLTVRATGERGAALAVAMRRGERR